MLVAAVVIGLVLASSGVASAQGRYRWPQTHLLLGGRALHERVLHERAIRGGVPSARARAAVVGGSRVGIEQVPWQAEVFAEFESGSGLSCGGVILDSTQILTAGHCTYDLETGARLSAGAFVIVAGTASVTAEEIRDNPAVQAKFVAGVRVHPDFDYALGPGAPDDVAVLTLERPLMFDATVQPIGLLAAGAALVEGAPVNLTGFGEQSPGSEPDGLLYSLGMTVGPGEQCGGEADAVFVCASAPGGSGCSGDSGSGLTSGSPAMLAGVMDTVEVVSGKPCVVGGDNGFVNTAAPEIRDFIEGSESPPVAPRGGSGLTIRGVSQVGDSLTCSPGSWGGEPAFTYMFVDSATGQVLQSGAATVYPLAAADIGDTIYCELQASNAGGTAVVRTAALPAIVASTAAPLGGELKAIAVAHEREETEKRAREEAERRLPTTASLNGTPETSTKETPALESGGVTLVATSIIVQSNGMALVKLNCLGIETCHGKLTLTAKDSVEAKDAKGKKARSVAIGTVSYSVAGDETKTVKVKLDAAGRALLSADRGRCSAGERGDGRRAGRRSGERLRRGGWSVARWRGVVARRGGWSVAWSNPHQTLVVT